MDTEVGTEDRDVFLRRQGWTDSLPEADRKAIEEEWTDAKIRMALDLNLA